MYKNSYFLLAGVMGACALASCDNDVEHIELQTPFTYDEQYFQNIRDFKKSDHELSFAYYEAWAPSEGADGFKDPASWGERFVGLPDSIDVVNVWMDLPTPEKHPVAYADMRYCQEKLGTRFVMHGDASHYRHQFTAGGQEYDMGGSSNVSDEVMEAYALYIRESVEAASLDGVDIDYEGWNANNLTRLVNILSQYYGPKGSDPSKMLIVDFYSAQPPAELTDLVDFFVAQDYSDQTGGLRSFSQYPQEKMVHCEQFGNGDMGQTGAKLLDYARWEPGDGSRKGGCGVYFLGRNYYSNSGIPYNEFRQAIQIMNPAVHK